MWWTLQYENVKNTTAMYIMQWSNKTGFLICLMCLWRHQTSTKSNITYSITQLFDLQSQVIINPINGLWEKQNCVPQLTCPLMF